jgi:hypothetical protein
MDEGMSSEKFFRIITYLKEAKSVTSAMTLPSDSRFNSQKLHLLGMLDRIQHLVVSLRADFIDLFYFKSPYEAGAAEAPDVGESSGEVSCHPSGERRSNVVSFDRRRSAADRRRLNTFLGRDRRSGIVDRRQRRRERDPSTPFSLQRN